MLENLPAKRVCKQIFPMDKNNKNRNHNNMLKKNKQQQLQRSNLYKTNVLRQTRARQQMAQAAKILSKTKNKKQHKQQQQQMKNVSKTVASTKAAAAVVVVNDKRILRKTKSTTTTTATTTSIIKKSDNEERQIPNRQTTTKKNKQNIKPEQQQQINSKQLQQKQTSVKKAAIEEANNPPPTTTIIQATITATSITTTKTPTKTRYSEFDTKLLSLPEYGNSNASSTSTCTSNTLNSSLSAAIMAVTTTATTTSSSSSSTTPMITRKRSKRISDCIAMLTGKLEEKLKTEQHPITPTKINTRSATNLINNQTELLKKPLPEITKTTTTTPAISTTINTTTTALTSPKTPKRKAQSRRIIKPPSIENLVTHVDLTISPRQPLLQQMPIITTTTEIPSFLLPVVSLVRTTITTTNPTKTISKSTSTANNIQPITTATTTTTSSMVIVTTTKTPTTQQSIVIPTTATPSIPLELPHLHDITTPATKATTMPLLPASPLVKVNVNMPPKLASNFQHLPVPISMQNFALTGLPSQFPRPSIANTNMNKNNSGTADKTKTVAATNTPLISIASNNNRSKATPISTVKISPTNYASPSILATTMPLPLTSVPITLMPAHHETPAPLLTHSASGEMEQPLNLSSSCAIIGPTDQNSTDLSNGRRNVILGMPTYPMDNYNIMFQNVESGPLDLSTKCHTKNKNTVTKEAGGNNTEIMMPLALTVTSTAMPISQFISTTTSDMTIFNKQQQQQYYSNLHLLKIPQIRNSAYSTTTISNMTSTPPITTATITTPNISIINMSKNNNYVDIGNINNNNNVVQMLQGSAITTTKATMVVAPIIKKRGGSRQQNLYEISSLSATTATATPTTSANMSYINTTTATTITTPSKILQKKEYASRYKAPPAPLTMNEEVINHIDDAINSVINAVNASLSPERGEHDCVDKMSMVEACKPAQSEITLTKSTPTINADVITTSTATTFTTTTTTTGLSTQTNAISNVNNTTTTTPQPLATILPVKRRGRSKASDHQVAHVEHFVQPLTSDATPILPNAYVANFTCDLSCPQNITPIPTEVTVLLKTADKLKAQQPSPLCVTTAISTTATITTASATPTVSIKPRSKIARSMVCLIEDISEPMPPSTPTKLLPNLVQQEQLELWNQSHNVGVTEEKQQQQQSFSMITKTTTTSEPISNISSTTTATQPPPIIQNIADTSEQPKQQDAAITTTATTIIENTAATTTTTSNNNNYVENLQTNGKKFRRRRKNELAAIVADQLLESFKLDKARRDNLKKLENLAYEKSDDLFMTGMLLMSSTKRSATLNSAKQKQQQQQQQQEEKEQHNNVDELINNDEMENCNNNNNKRTGLRTRTTRQSNNNNKNNNSAANDDKFTTTAKNIKDGRRRQYRRRGKTLDNENISKLKSSLESFSIGIERQLSEFEAKKERLNEAATKTNNNNNSGIKMKPCSVILRPSILAASIEPPAELITAPLTQENVAKVSSSLAQDNGKSSAFSCRDPRLNKNIHKELSDGAEKASVNNYRQESKNNNVDSCEEEDNYLTEIAKNVNEKIMENEDFMFANDDGLLGLDDTQSSHFYSRPPTSMSVRSAPNFDDRSNYGSMCGDDDDDEITNTEVMDMDLDDDMSVYTSYSQDVGSGGRRRRRRRRSILLTRRPKKRINRDPSQAEKFECTLCKKIFFSATSLSKHNMTLAHVSKVSEQEYLLSRAAMIEQGGLVAMANELPMSFPKSTNSKRAKTPTPTSANKRAKTPTPTTTTNTAPRGRAKTPTPSSVTTSLKGRAKTPTPTTTTGSRGRAKTPTPTALKGRAKTPTATLARVRAKTPSPTTITSSKGHAKSPTPKTTTSKRGKTPIPTQNRHVNTFEDQFSSTPNITTSAIKPNNPLALAEDQRNVREKEKHVTCKEMTAMQTATTTESHAFGTSSHLTLNPDERLFFECCTILKGTDTVRPSNPTTPSKMDEIQFELQNKDSATVADNDVNYSKPHTTTKKHHIKTAGTFRDPLPCYNKTEQ